MTPNARKRWIPALAVGAAALLAPDPGQAQSSGTFLLTRGTAVPGVGNVIRIDGSVINGTGSWAAVVKTDQINPATDQVLMRDGAISLREGTALGAPAGATLDGFGPLDMDESGNLFQILALAGTSAGSGLFRNGSPLILAGDVSTAPQFGAGTVFRGFLNVRSNGSGTELVLVAAVDDPTAPGTVEPAILRVSLSGGVVTGQTVIAKRGDVLPGQTQPVSGVGTGRNDVAINEPGNVLFHADLRGDPALDGVIYLDGTLIAQEGSVSADSTRNYENLASRALDLDDAGGYAFQADLDGSTTDDAVIVQNGAIPVREFDNRAIPGLPGRIVDFGPPFSPVDLDAGGLLTWYAKQGSFEGTVKDGASFVVRPGSQVDGQNLVQFLTSVNTFQLSRVNDWALVRLAVGVSSSPTIGLAMIPGTAAEPVAAPVVASPARLDLRAFPNPTRGEVQVRFSVDRESELTVRVFDVTGRRLGTLFEGTSAPGSRVVAWPGTDEHGRRVAPGTYFVRLSTGNREISTRVTLVQ